MLSNFNDIFLITGCCCISYFICRLFRLWSLYLEDSNSHNQLLILMIIGIQFVFGFLSLPVWIIFTFFENQAFKRIEKLHEKEIASVRFEFIEKCANCRNKNDCIGYESPVVDPLDLPNFDYDI